MLSCLAAGKKAEESEPYSGETIYVLLLSSDARRKTIALKRGSTADVASLSL